MADYAAYALRAYGVLPKQWAEMEVPERMFICGVIDLDLERMKREKSQ